MARNPDRLDLAQRQLARVQTAALEPADWSDLSMYGLYALENAVIAGADRLGIPWKRTHSSKAGVARLLHAEHGLPDVAELLRDLNEVRKSEAYGEVRQDIRLDPEDVSIALETYVEEVKRLINGARGSTDA